MTTTPLYYDLSATQRAALLAEAGAPNYAAGQIDTWVFRKLAVSFDAMTNLSKAVRQHLNEHSMILGGTAAERQVSADGTVKLLIQCADKARIECVAIPQERRLTLCISTMSGCPVRCTFCASGRSGLNRKLSSGEMLTQFLLLAADAHRHPTNLVLMGMGEPLLNYEAAIGFIRTVNAPARGDLGARHITVSTIGVPEGITRLADEGLALELAFSLHHPSQAARAKLIPLARKYSLQAILTALEYYTLTTSRRVTFEYCLLAGVNDSIACARKTALLAHDLRAKVNLIPYNGAADTGFTPPDKTVIRRFQDILASAGVPVTLRKQRGADIEAACGQLAAKTK